MRQQSTRRAASLAAIVTVTLAVAASGVASAGSTAPPQSGGEDCIDGAATVGFVPKLDTDPYFSTAQLGAEEAAEELDGEAVRQAPSVTTADAQIEIINTLVTQQVDVIAIAGNDANALAPALQRARDQGVRVISYDSDVAPEARTLFVNQVDSDTVAAQMLDSMSRPDRRRRPVRHSLVDADCDQPKRLDHFDRRSPGVGHQVRRHGVDRRDLLRRRARRCQSGSGAGDDTGVSRHRRHHHSGGYLLPAAARALDDAGLLGDVTLTGLAPASLISEYIEGGSVQDIWWNVRDLGYLTFHAANALATCEISGEEGDTFEAGRLGEFTVGVDGEVILGPAVIVTPENVDEFEF